MRPDCPKIRDDLQYTTLEGQGGTEVIVFDPVVCTYHKLDELQAIILKRLDGQHSLPDLARALAKELDAEIPIEVLRELIAKVRSMGLLDVGSSSELSARGGQRAWKAVQRRARDAGVAFRRGGTRGPPGAERRQRADVAELFDEALHHLERGRAVQAMRALHAVLELAPDNARAAYLKKLVHEETVRAREPERSWNQIRIKLFDPEPVLDWLLRYLRPVVNWKGYLGLFLWFVLGAVLIFPELDHVAADIGRAPKLIAAHPGAVAIVYALSLLQFLGHEMFHGLACRSFGGRVPSIGILLAFLIFPGAYCDTSATYTYTNRWSRVLVAAAGIGFQMLTYTIAVAVYRVVPRGSLASVVALSELMNCWGVVVFTAVPFFKNDGYFALADAVGVPRLWEISSQYSRNTVQRLFLGLQPSEQAAAMTERAGLGIAAYAVTGMATTLLLTLTVYLTVTIPMMATALRGPGFLLALVPFSFIFVPPIWRGARLVWTRRHEVARSRRARVTGVLLLLALVLGALVPLPWSVEVPFRVPSEGVGWARVESRADAVVASLEVRVGDRVKAGDVLARLDDTAARLAIVSARDDLETARSTLAGREREDRERAAAVAGGAKYSALLAQLEARRVAHEAVLAKQGLASAADVDRARLRGAGAATARTEAMGELTLRLAGLSAEERKHLEQQVAHAELVLKQHEEALDALVLRAPRDGVVVKTCARRGEVTPGGVSVAAGTPVVELRTDEPLSVVLKVPIEYRRYLRDGASVRLWLGGEWRESTMRMSEHDAVNREQAETEKGIMQATKSLTSTAIEARGFVDMRTAPVPFPELRGGSSGQARIGLAPITGFQWVAWHVKFFIGYYWWTLW